MGVSDTVESWLLEPESWERIQSPEPEHEGGYSLGIDLGTSAAMSAVAGYWPDTGALECLAAFPELPSLAERGLRDGVGPLYENCQRRGELVIAGQRVSDVSALLGEALARWGPPSVITADRWREAELREKLEALDFPMCELIVRGQGYKDGGEDVRAFRAACLGDAVRAAPSLLLTSAMAEARTVIDAAGNAKLAKGAEGARRMNARDDAAAAAILAVAVGYRLASTGKDDDRAILCDPVMGRIRRLDRRRWELLRQVVLDRAGWRCQACGRAGRMEVDHVRPLRHGGEPYALDNLQALCGGCHKAKSNAEATGYRRRPETRRKWLSIVNNLATDSGG